MDLGRGSFTHDLLELYTFCAAQHLYILESTTFSWFQIFSLSNPIQTPEFGVIAVQTSENGPNPI
jgi:hypothetical protein